MLLVTIIFCLTIYVVFFQAKNNLPPEKPSTPTGIVTINIRQNASYRSLSHDPDNDSIRYGWDWDGNGTVDEWTKWYSPNATLVDTIHQWKINGTFYLKVKAQDIHGAESQWSDSLRVTVNFVPSHPNRPNLTGPTSLVAGEVGVYYALTSTVDGLPIRFFFMWGDTSYNSTDFVNSGEMANASHAWNTPGNYTVVCEAENKYSYRSVEAILNVVINKK
jgi:hypothetical protein